MPLRRRSMCANCGKREGVVRWGDALAMTHGGGVLRCERCVYGPQIRHALKRAKALPRLVLRFGWAVLRNA